MEPLVFLTLQTHLEVERITNDTSILKRTKVKIIESALMVFVVLKLPFVHQLLYPPLIFVLLMQQVKRSTY